MHRNGTGKADASSSRLTRQPQPSNAFNVCSQPARTGWAVVVQGRLAGGNIPGQAWRGGAGPEQYVGALPRTTDRRCGGRACGLRSHNWRWQPITGMFDGDGCHW